jgi:exosortase
MGEPLAHAAPTTLGRFPALTGPQVRAAAILGAASLYCFWPTLDDLAGKWLRDPQYSHGLLVPLFSLYLLWTARDRFPADVRRAPLLGGLVLTAAAVCRFVGGLIYFEWLEAFALVPFIAGLVLTFGGGRVLRWSMPAVLFLLYMIPLPYRLQITLGEPLQRLATLASTYVLQTFGQPALAEGNTILIRDFRLGIVEACSGLRMLVTFFTFSTAVCLVVRKPFTDKLCILLSAIPIALLVNVTRIVVTGVMYLHVSSHTATVFFHDLAGWFMMPMALLMLWAELWVLRRLIVELPTRPAVR